MTDAGAPTRRKIWIDLLLYPGHSLPTAAAPVVLAVGLAVHNHVFRPLPVFLGFVASWLIHVGGLFTDNYLLITKYPKLREHPEFFVAIEHGILTLARLKWAIVACFVLSVLPGPYLVLVAGAPVILLGIVGMAASLGYSVGRYAMTRLGIADPLFFVMFGIVAVAGSYYVQAAPAFPSSTSWLIVPQALPSAAFLIGLPLGAIITNIMLIDDLRDRDFDRLKGWRTGPVLFGPNWTRAEFTALMVFAYLIPLWFWLGLGFSAWVLLTWATLPEAIAITIVIWTQDTFAALFPMTPRTARLSLDYAVLLAIGVAVATS